MLFVVACLLFVACRLLVVAGCCSSVFIVISCVLFVGCCFLFVVVLRVYLLFDLCSSCFLLFVVLRV